MSIRPTARSAGEEMARAREKPVPTSCLTVTAALGRHPSLPEHLIPAALLPGLVPGPHLTPTSASWRALRSPFLQPLGTFQRPPVFLLPDALLSHLALSYHLPPSPGLYQGGPRAELLPAPPRATCPHLRPSLLSLPWPAPVALIGLAGPRKPTSQPEKPQPNRLGLLGSPVESTEATVAVPNP